MLCDICTCFKRYLYSAKCTWIINISLILDVLLRSIAEYFYELCAVFWQARRVSQTTNNELKFSVILHNKTSNKRFIIQHTKLVCLCKRIFCIFIYRVCVTCEGEQSIQSGTELAREIQRTDWSMAGNLSYRSSGSVQIPRDICTRLKAVRANCFCTSLLRTQIHMPRHATSCIERTR